MDRKLYGLMLLMALVGGIIGGLVVAGSVGIFVRTEIKKILDLEDASRKLGVTVPRAMELTRKGFKDWLWEVRIAGVQDKVLQLFGEGKPDEAREIIRQYGNMMTVFPELAERDWKDSNAVMLGRIAGYKGMKELKMHLRTVGE